MLEQLLTMIYHQRLCLAHDVEEYIDHEEYTLEEQRYDEGYDNALLWVSLEIGKMLHKGEKAND